MSDDPIISALEEVDADGDHDDPGAGHAPIGEEADAMPEGPMPDLEAEDVDEDSGSVLSWARRVPEGSHLDFDKRDWWDPETGGTNRLAYHLSDATPEGVGYPNGLGVLVGAAEFYWSKVREQNGGGGGDDRADEGHAPDAEEVDRSTAEGLV